MNEGKIVIQNYLETRYFLENEKWVTTDARTVAEAKHVAETVNDYNGINVTLLSNYSTGKFLQDKFVHNLSVSVEIKIIRKKKKCLTLFKQL